jgi:hypothetical protein
MPRFPRLCTRIYSPLDIDGREDIDIVDNLPTGDQINHKKEMAKTKASKLADMMHLHYIDGKITDDIWQEVLAKRVIRNMKKNVIRNWRLRLAQTLYNCAEFDKHTSIQLAKTIPLAYHL